MPLADATLPTIQHNVLGIPGLTFAPKFLDEPTQRTALQAVDQYPWRTDLRRRVQYFGYKYDYKSRSIDPAMRIAPIPPFAQALARQLLETGLIPKLPDQLLINEYLPGQGISAHIDCVRSFEDAIATISLSSPCEIEFLPPVNPSDIRPILLSPGSALILTAASRHHWQHRIRARMSDHGIRRGRRISLTFRNVILSPEFSPQRTRGAAEENAI